MSQHDFSINNQGATASRSDINNALQALASLSSGASAPSTTYANMLWYETDANTLWMRNEADSAWLRLMYINQSDGHRFIENEVVNTGGTATGFLGVHAESTWETGTNTEDRLVSPEKIKAAIDALAPTLTIPTTEGAVDTYAFLRHETANVQLTWGSTYAGSVLGPKGIRQATSTTSIQSPVEILASPSGTWRCMGHVDNGGGQHGITLFVRIS